MPKKKAQAGSGHELRGSLEVVSVEGTPARVLTLARRRYGQAVYFRTGTCAKMPPNSNGQQRGCHISHHARRCRGGLSFWQILVRKDSPVGFIDEIKGDGRSAKKALEDAIMRDELRKAHYVELRRGS